MGVVRLTRGVGVAIGFLSITLFFIPMQWAALRFKWRIRDVLPIQYARGICAVMGIRVETFGRPCREPGVLLASNHTSYLDMPVLAAVIPLAFIAKSEVAGWPLFGTLSKLARTVFVERERRTKAGLQADRIRQRLEEGGTIVLFAEGTSSDGNRVLPFKSALLSAADAMVTDENGQKRRVLVQPVSVAYTRLHGIPMGREIRPYFAWYGDMELVPHLWEAFCLGPIDVMVHYHPPITVDQFPSRKDLTAECERLVAEGVAHALAGRPGAVGPAYEDEPIEVPPVNGDGLRPSAA
ncbi:MAG: lysophospholipid acyltransferase family protein [Alphaproteobacteria bacterium]|jgi:1-acyl-sn-glycerol-3-phosphate acyltransferase|nr:lysophospholipid acyltransferase family protein [Alphaproteobacteria bacterium]